MYSPKLESMIELDLFDLLVHLGLVVQAIIYLITKLGLTCSPKLVT